MSRKKSCSLCGAPGVTATSHRADGTHSRRGRPGRRPGCRICGSRDHYTKGHYGPGDRKAAIVRLTPLVRRRRGIRPEPLGIARSSWLVNGGAPWAL